MLHQSWTSAAALERKLDEVSRDNTKISKQLQEVNTKYFDSLIKLSTSTNECKEVRKNLLSAEKAIQEYEQMFGRKKDGEEGVTHPETSAGSTECVSQKRTSPTQEDKSGSVPRRGRRKKPRIIT